MSNPQHFGETVNERICLTSTHRERERERERERAREAGTDGGTEGRHKTLRTEKNKTF